MYYNLLYETGLFVELVFLFVILVIQVSELGFELGKLLHLHGISRVRVLFEFLEILFELSTLFLAIVQVHFEIFNLTLVILTLVVQCIFFTLQFLTQPDLLIQIAFQIVRRVTRFLFQTGFFDILDFDLVFDYDILKVLDFFLYFLILALVYA
jgi:hypothetical protein